MCDYSLESVQSRPAKVGDRLTTRLFRTQTRGFSARKIFLTRLSPPCVSRKHEFTKWNGYHTGLEPRLNGGS